MINFFLTFLFLVFLFAVAAYIMGAFYFCLKDAETWGDVVGGLIGGFFFCAIWLPMLLVLLLCWIGDKPIGTKPLRTSPVVPSPRDYQMAQWEDKQRRNDERRVRSA
jgi:hypothetical protein